MRIAAILTIPMLGVLTMLPARAPAQLNVTVQFGARLGPEIGVYAYDAGRQGDWRTSSSRWTPVTLYDVNGHYYRTAVRGARPVVVYTYNNEYFLPPQDRGWVGSDRRYNYRRQPNQADYGRERPYVAEPRVDPRLGAEISMVAYSPDRAGNWRNNYRRWTPTVVYEVNGRYYPNSIQGARPVSVYRYRSEYFMPPQDQAWNGYDRRFNYQHQPNQDDQGRAHGRP